MSAIGMVEDAWYEADQARTALAEAASAADEVGRSGVAQALRELFEDMDDLANRISQQREVLRA
jgi:hypothetical protein